MSIDCVKNLFYERVACVCLTFGITSLVFATFVALVFLMGVITFLFSLPVDLHKSLWITEVVI